ncbi:Alpha/Beta hydrolase protein [Thelonectria olida]|uniref:Alpha/Beta hydrolase protein n=1 Tax=Thelonectria olida TaxID=1576542 RepID=A0A9P8WHT2_9HYPO|nr:Alpha/Beta hydrolase protein [Thelonectria olida]
MRFFTLSVILFALLAAICPTATEAKKKKKPDLIFTDNMQYKANSTFCERRTIDHEHQLWFSFYPSRLDIENAPTILWFPDGPGMPGSWDMVGANGPCTHSHASEELHDNFYSLNTWANILYVDGPVSSGFSHGEILVTTRQAAAKLMRMFFVRFADKFPEYFQNQVVAWGVGYGAHLATAFAADMIRKNTLNKMERKEGVDPDYAFDYKFFPIHKLVLDSPLLDLTTQFKSAIEYSHYNNLSQIIPQNESEAMLNTFETWYEKRWTNCSTYKQWDCKKELQEFGLLWGNLTNRKDEDGNMVDPHNILKETRLYENLDENIAAMKNSARYRILTSKKAEKGLGLRGKGTMRVEHVNYDVYTRYLHDKFWNLGDSIRSSAEDLELVLNAGFGPPEDFTPAVNTFMFVGEADLLANPLGVRRVIDKMEWPHKKQFDDAKFQRVLYQEQTAMNKQANTTEHDIGMVRASNNLVVYELKNLGRNTFRMNPPFGVLMTRTMRNNDPHPTYIVWMDYKHLNEYNVTDRRRASLSTLSWP